jgi:hypothetical protein
MFGGKEKALEVKVLKWYLKNNYKRQDSGKGALLFHIHVGQ